MIALACHALFGSAAAIAIGSIAVTIISQRDRIARLLSEGPTHG